MSVGQEMISFLTPNFNEPIQLIFFTLMMGGAVFTAIKVKLSATPENWEQKWNGGTVNDFSDDLDAEHGSVSDISNAVATSWEKLSEAMPGILLILGLLGTFLGLGIALNKASTILDSASAAGMDDSMANLMGMMQGLGTKFKTSTWGIFAFLALKIWISYDGFEESRLRWCIRKIKGELDSKRAAAQKQQQGEHQQFIAAIGQLGERLCHTLHNEISDNRSVLQKNQDLLSKKVELLMENNASAVTATNLLTLQLEKSETIINNSLESRTALEEIIKQQNDRLCNTLQSEISDNRVVLQKNQGLLSKKVELLMENNANTLATRTVLESFVKANTDNLQSMQRSSSEMADAASRVGESAVDLKSAISSFKDGVADVLDSLKSDLNETFEQMSAQNKESAADLKETIGTLQSGVSEVMTTMKSDLSESISEMNDSFGKNMGKMSADLEGATNDISSAVNSLSSSVDTTMTTVKNSLEKSSRTQIDGMAVIAEKSEGLSITIGSLDGLIKKVTTDISKSLGSVADSNRNVISLVNRSAGVTESIEKLSDEIKRSFDGHVELLTVTNDSNKTQQTLSEILALIGSINRNVFSAIQAAETKRESVEASA